MLIIFIKCTPESHDILDMIFFSSLSSNLKWTKIWGKKQTNKKKKTVFAVHAFDTAATLKKKKKISRSSNLIQIGRP